MTPLLPSHKKDFLSLEQKGSLYAISAGFCYGLLGYFGITLMNEQFSVFNMLFWRFFISTIVILILLLPSLKQVKDRPRDLLRILISGATFYGGSSIFLFIASRYIGTGLTTVIFFTYPAMILFFNAVFYKAQINKIYYVAITLILLGLVLLTNLQSVEFHLIGIGLALLTGALYAAYMLVNKGNTVSPLNSSLMVSMGCMITFFIGSLFTHSFFIPHMIHHWIYIIGIGVVCTALPILLLLQGLKYISSEKTAILSVLEPVFMVILGVLLLHEKIHILQVIGICIVLLGAMMTLFSRPTPLKS
jgi:drug/metabolite transporter (DMT)-like permease